MSVEIQQPQKSIIEVPEGDVPTPKEKHEKKKKPLPFPYCDINLSNDPSYTNLKLPYCVICRLRSAKQAAKQLRQFQKEIAQHELLQTFALYGVRVHRIFAPLILNPLSNDEIVKLTPKEHLRVLKILDD